MADDVIEKLSIEIESSAKKATPAIDNLIKKINTLSSTLNKIDGKDILKPISKLNNINLNNTNNSMKKAVKNVENFSSRLKDVGKIKVETNNLKEIEKNIDAINKKIKRLTSQKEEKDFFNLDTSRLQYQLARAKNELESYQEQFKKVKASQNITSPPIYLPGEDKNYKTELPKPSKEDFEYYEKIEAAKKRTNELGSLVENINQNLNRVGENAQKVTQSIENTANEALKFSQATDVIGNKWSNLKDKANNFKFAISQLGNYSGMQKELAVLETRLENLLNKQERFLESGGKKGSSTFKNLEYDIDSVEKKINSLETDINRINKIPFLSNLTGSNSKSSTGGFFGNLSKQFSNLIKKIKLLKKSTNKFSIPKMIGMSVLYSTVFQAISGIETALKEGIDNLVQYSDMANQSISMFTSSLTYLKNSFAAAFAPILDVVVPVITTFINYIAQAINVVGQFISALTGKGFAIQAKKVQENYAAGLRDTGKAAKDTAKEIKNVTLGFDELHVVSADKDNAGAGGGAAGPSVDNMFETVEIDSKIKSFADSIREAFKSGDFEGLGENISNVLKDALWGIKWNEVYEGARSFGSNLAEFLNGLIKPDLFYAVGRTIANALNTALEFLNSFGNTFDWTMFGVSIAAGINGFFTNFKFDLAAETLNAWATGILESIRAALAGVRWRLIGEQIGTFIAEIDFGEILSGIGAVIWEALKASIELGAGLFDAAPIESAIVTAIGLLKFSGVGSNVLKSLGPVLSRIGPAIASFITSPWGAAISAAVIGVITIAANWDDIKPYIEKVGQWFADMSDKIDEIMGGLIETFLNWASESIKTLVEGAVQIATDVGQWFVDMSDKIDETMGNLIEGFIQWVSDSWNTFSEGITKIVTDVVTWFAELPGKAYTKIHDFVSKVIEWAGNVKEEFSTQVNDIIDSVAEWFKDLPGKIYDAVTEMWEKIVSIGTYIKDGIMEGLNKVGNSIKDFINGLLGATEKEAEIGSPSKLFRDEVGVFLGQGIAVGLDKSKPIILDTINNIIAAIIDAFNNMPQIDLSNAINIKDDKKPVVDTMNGMSQLSMGTDQMMIAQSQEFLSMFNEVWQNGWRNVFISYQEIMSQILDMQLTFNEQFNNQWLNFDSIMREGIDDFLSGLYNYVYELLDAIRVTVDHVCAEFIYSVHRAIAQAEEAADLLELNVSYAKLSPYKTKAAEKVKIKGFKTGGFPNMGDLFIANEAGPEFVGKIGNQTAVANNDQIVTAIEQAVLRGMSTAMASQNTQPIEINVTTELDGETVYNNQQRVAARRGYNFNMGAFAR